MKYTLIFFTLLFISNWSFAQNDLRAKHFNIENKLAIQGYDPVAYFTLKKAIKGKSVFAVSHQGVVYYFVSQANKDIFLKNPSGYEPQYGGWCAYAMGESGEKVEIDPETYKIVNGRLYLFYNAYFNNTLKSWNKNEAELKKKADKNWTIIFK